MNEIMKNLWITDIGCVQRQSTKQFDHVVTVCQDSVEDNVGCEYSFFPMADGPHNAYGGDFSYELFKEAANAVLLSLLNDQCTLVHCHVGQSRSAAVCIAVYAVYNDVHYDDAYNAVSSVRNINPDPLLVDHAQRYTNEWNIFQGVEA